MPAGRPSKLTPQLLEKAREYVVSCVDNIEKDEHGRVMSVDVNLPSIEGMADYLDLARATLYDWTDKESPRYNEEFSDIFEAVLRKQITRLFSGGLSGKYNSAIAKLLLAKHGYKDSVDYTTGDKPIKSVNINIIDGTQPECEQDIQEECTEQQEDNS